MKRAIFSFLLAICAYPTLSEAGVFNIPEFVEYRSWAVGLEPELTLSSYGNQTSGLGFNAKYTYGITPLSNLQAAFGGGAGSKGFRMGSTYSFDFIPDLNGQLGFGVATQAYYFSLSNSSSQFELSAYPYLHKAMKGPSALVLDPYMALIYGLALYAGNYRAISQLALGSAVKTSEHFRVNLELGLSLSKADSYLSFGITYRD